MGIIYILNHMYDKNIFIHSINPIPTGLWNDVINWGGVKSSRTYFRVDELAK